MRFTLLQTVLFVLLAIKVTGDDSTQPFKTVLSDVTKATFELCSTKSSKDGSKNDIVVGEGTVFLVSLDPTDEWLVLLSNRHLFENPELGCIRYNVAGGKYKNSKYLYLEDIKVRRSKVISPTSPLIDLAAIIIDSVPSDWNAKPYPILELLQSADSIGAGDEVYFLGFPVATARLGNPLSLPMLRRGMIGMDQELFESFYVVDGVAIAGNSGSPTFDRSGKIMGIIAKVGYVTLGVDVTSQLIDDSAKAVDASHEPHPASIGLMVGAERVRLFLEVEVSSYIDSLRASQSETK